MLPSSELLYQAVPASRNGKHKVHVYWKAGTCCHIQSVRTISGHCGEFQRHSRVGSRCHPRAWLREFRHQVCWPCYSDALYPEFSMLCTPKLMLVGTREVGKPCEGLVYLDAGLSIKCYASIFEGPIWSKHSIIRLVTADSWGRFYRQFQGTIASSHI